MYAVVFFYSRWGQGSIGLRPLWANLVTAAHQSSAKHCGGGFACTFFWGGRAVTSKKQRNSNQVNEFQEIKQIALPITHQTARTLWRTDARGVQARSK